MFTSRLICQQGRIGSLSAGNARPRMALRRPLVRTAVLMAVVAAAALTNIARATTYDLANDFSITTNGGTNPWSYGVYTSGLSPASYSPFTNTTTGAFGALDVWSLGGSDPNLEKNVTNSPNSGCCGITWPANEVAFGPYLGPTVARWTAPATSLYDISATFTPIQTGNSSPNGYVYLDSSQLTNLTLSGTPFVGTNFSDSLVLIHAGQTLDFVVWGGNVNNKTTEVQATINAVPEPSGFLLCGLGAVGLLIAARRRRKA